MLIFCHRLQAGSFIEASVDDLLGMLIMIQARDLVAVLTESKQQIDPRLHEMARYGGGGGGGRYGGGRGGGRGGRGGGGGYSGSNSAPMGGGRRW